MENFQQSLVQEIPSIEKKIEEYKEKITENIKKSEQLLVDNKKIEQDIQNLTKLYDCACMFATQKVSKKNYELLSLRIKEINKMVKDDMKFNGNMLDIVFLCEKIVDEKEDISYYEEVNKGVFNELKIALKTYKINENVLHRYQTNQKIHGNVSDELISDQREKLCGLTDNLINIINKLF